MLESIGVPKNEAVVYLALVKRGKSTASEIAAYTGMHRPNIYDILKRLGNKGLISSFNLDNKMHHKALGVEGIKDFLEEKITYTNKIAEELERYKAKESECEISVFSGKKAMRVLENDILETLKEQGGESWVMGVDDSKYMDLDEITLRWFFNQMEKYGFREKVIVGEGESYFPGLRSVTDYATLPMKYFDSATSHLIYGDRVSIFIMSEPYYLIMIKSKTVADVYRKQFKLLWKEAKKVPKHKQPE